MSVQRVVTKHTHTVKRPARPPGPGSRRPAPFWASLTWRTNENQKTETYLIEPAIPFQEMKAYEVASKKADFKEHFVTIEKILEN